MLLAALRGVGQSLSHLGRYEEAIPHYERGLEMARAQNDKTIEALCVFGLADCRGFVGYVAIPPGGG
ncbi:MAG: tetratricopeptide repeat protein [Anaerolineaceae bacterium]